jgi:F0F1-type ATP synthase membrane subunit c/vacuolar-type H+-ATPase subunit K
MSFQTFQSLTFNGLNFFLIFILLIYAGRLIGAGVGIGVVFGALILGVARNPSLRSQLFSYAILGFAFAEATGLTIDQYK